MANQASTADVKTALADAIASGHLPTNLQSNAEAMLAFLSKPLRVSLMGLPHTGKSQLLNLLAGQIVIPDGAHLPTTQLIYGDTVQTTCTMPDGSAQVLDHCDVETILGLSPVFVQMELPLAALKKISILEVVASDDHIEQQRAMLWAVKRTDVALWCSHTFSIPEQTLWAAMPDVVKDHAFLVITKADVLDRNDLLETTMRNVKNVADHEFNQILPIAIPHALSARLADGQIDKDALRRAGGLSLISGILRQVEMGQQATVDKATVLLRQVAGMEAATPPKIVAPKEDDPAPVAKTAFSAVPSPITSRAIRSRVPPPAKRVGDEYPVPLPPKKKVPDAPAKLKPESFETYKEAIGYLTREGRALAKSVEIADTVPVAKIMKRSVANVQWLADHLQDSDQTGDPVLDSARDAAIDAADLIQLMQLEKQENAVLDAISLVLQLKHGLEADLAA